MGNKYKEILSSFPIIIFIIYCCGFLVWNIYLSMFGFFEYNLLQTRYISAGILFVLSLFYIYTILKILFEIIKNIKTTEKIISYILKFQIVKIILVLIFSMVSAFYLFLYSLFIFPKIPQFIGGSKPMAANLIGDVTQINYLKNFNMGFIPNGKNDSVQTHPMCILYQNQEYLLIGVLEWRSAEGVDTAYPIRILNLKNDEIKGFQPHGGFVKNVNCPASAFYNL